jgi:dienelactone hydrolase
MITVAVLAAGLLLGRAFAGAASLPERDLRGGAPRTLNTLRAFPEISSLADWESRAREVREQVLVSCGLWPLPERAPLQARIFGRIERDGYSIEKVYFQTHAGFYLAGNLYRPLGHGPGPFPAVLNPHGHWSNGRMADEKDGSIAARCINFARQGMVAFSYDMVGYNDTRFAGTPGEKTHHSFGAEPVNQLWGISLMGLQTWNSLRALDFLESLPDADKSRLACTGESGGGTQTFMLGSIDRRLAAQAPVVMVSHSMQGGCLCENAPGLRVEYSNMEIAAAAAPRPQILVAAAGDWTKATLTVEGPALEKVYRLFQAPEKLRYVRLDFNHNYNQSSREQVYGWFGQWLRGLPQGGPLPEQPYHKEPDAELLVFPDGKLPEGAVTEAQLVQNLTRQFRQQWLDPFPGNPALLQDHRKAWLPAWKHSFQVAFVDQGLLVETQRTARLPDGAQTELALGRAGKGDRLAALWCQPRRERAPVTVVLALPSGIEGCTDTNRVPTGLARQLLERGLSVLLIDLFHTGGTATAALPRDYFKDFFTTYNRTDCQERVQDLVTAAAFVRSQGRDRRVAFCGSGRAGLWTLLAAPAADLVAADCDGLRSENDEALLAQDLFVPGLRKLGAFEGVAILAAPQPLLLHNTGGNFSTAALQRVYKENRAAQRLRQQASTLADPAVADWLAQSARQAGASASR